MLKSVNSTTALAIAMSIVGMAQAQTGNIGWSGAPNAQQQVVVPSSYNTSLRPSNAQYANQSYSTTNYNAQVNNYNTQYNNAQTQGYGNNYSDYSTQGYQPQNSNYSSAGVQIEYSQSYAPAGEYLQSFNPFSSINLSAKAAIMVDVLSGTPLYQKNANKPRPIASMTKLMTAMTLLDSNADLYESITVIASDLVGAKKASTQLQAGDVLTRQELLLIMLMKSDNTAAKALARTSPYGYQGFLQMMNQRAHALGMYNANFEDTSGLDSDNVATAQEVAIMAGMARNYEMIKAYSTSKRYHFDIPNQYSGVREHNMNNTNRLVLNEEYPIMLSKTGYTRDAGRCVVMETISPSGRSVITVLMGSGENGARDADARKLLNSLT